MRQKIFIRTLFLFLLISCQAFSATYTFNGDGDGTSWDDDDNWDLNSVPDPDGDDVIIPAGFNVVNDTGGDLQFKDEADLTLNGSLDMDGESLKFEENKSDFIVGATGVLTDTKQLKFKKSKNHSIASGATITVEHFKMEEGSKVSMAGCITVEDKLEIVDGSNIESTGCIYFDCGDDYIVDDNSWVFGHKDQNCATTCPADVCGTAVDAPPTVTTTSDATVSCTAEDFTGNISSDGGDAITARGFVYYLASAGDNLEDGGGGVTTTTGGTATGAFTHNITGLTASTAYEYRAYATNGEGTTYGAQIAVTTDACPILTCNPCYSVASGDWSNTATWSNASGGASGYTPVTDGTVDIVIEGGFTVNFDDDFSVNELTVGSTGAGTLTWTAASKTLTMKGVGGIAVANNGSIQEGGQTDANIIFPDANVYTLTVAGGGAGLLECDNMTLSSSSTINLSGGGNVTVKDGIQLNGTGIAYNNNLTGTFNIENDIDFSSSTSGGDGVSIGYPTNFDNDGGDENPGVGNLTSANNVYNSVDIDDDDKVKGYFNTFAWDVTVPAGATINGVTVTVKAKWDNAETEDAKVKLREGGDDSDDHVVKTDLGTTDASSISGTDASAPWFGGDVDVDATTINTAGFGVKVDIKAKNGDNTLNFDYVGIQIDWSVAATVSQGSNTFTNNQTITFTGADADINFTRGASNNFVNNGTITGIDDVEFNSYVTPGATSTIWSEDFESYDKEDVAASNNNTANGANDWTLTNGDSDDEDDPHFCIGDNHIEDIPARETRHLQFHEGGNGAAGIWTTEAIDITGQTDVSISVEWMAHFEDNDIEVGDYLSMEYSTNGGGAWTALPGGSFDGTDLPNDHVNTTGTGAASGLTGTSLMIRATYYSDSDHEYISIDNVVVSSTAEGSLGGDNNTFTNNQSMTFAGADADIYFVKGISNSFVNNSTITGIDDINFSTAVTSNSFVGGNGSATTVNDKVLFTDLNGNSSNSITNDGDFNIANSIEIRQGGVTITNTAAGDIDVGGDLQMEDNNNTATTITNTGDFSMVGNVYLVASNEEADITNTGTDALFECVNIDASGGDLDVTNTGTINQTGTFVDMAAASTMVNGVSGIWNYGGTGHHASTNLTCSANLNTFNYNRTGSAQQIITAQGNDYHHLTISGDNTKTPLSSYTIDIEGDLTISNPATFDVATQGNDITIAGNWSNSSSGDFVEGTRTVTFDGTGDQGLTCSSIGTETFYDLRIGKNGGNKVVMNNNVAITFMLNFSGSNGYIDINTNDLTINNWDNGDINGYTNDEFVIVDNTGYIKVTGVDDGEIVNFPMGMAAGAASFGLADVTMTDATGGTIDGNLCALVTSTGVCGGGIAENDSVVRYAWHLLSNSTGAEVKLYWNTSQEFAGTFDRAISVVAHYKTGDSEWENLGVSGAATDESGTYGAGIWSRSGTTTSFSPFAVQMKGSPLPAELLSFSAIKVGDGSVKLDWLTGSEINNDFFTIERSSDGRYFEEVTTVQGAGNSTEEILYNDFDYSPYDGVNYYRIKQTDFDGTVTYSEVISVDLAEQAVDQAAMMSASVFPNPVKGSRYYVKIKRKQVENEEVLLVLRNAYGAEVYSKMVVAYVGETIVAVDMNGRVAPGIYMVTGSSDNELFRKKLVVK